MKAVIYRTYGGREVLSLEDAPDPGELGPHELRIRVHAASINPVDGKVRRGELKLIAGGRFPKRPGLDFSGTIEALGRNVSGLAVGDAVYGAGRSMSDGTLAEHVIVRAASIAKKPSALDHTRAACLPTVAVAALQCVRDIVKAKPTDRILVNGCTGGVGLVALQLIRRAGATVVGVCGSAGISLAKELGAAEVFDYRAVDWSRLSGSFTSVVELSGKLPFSDARRLLAKKGMVVDFSPTPTTLIAATLANGFRSEKHVFAMTAAKTADLEWLASRVDSGELAPPPVHVFPLSRFSEAFERVENGGFIGKHVVQIRPTE